MTYRTSSIVAATIALTCFSVITYASSSPAESIEIHFDDGHFVPSKIVVQAEIPLLIKVVNLSRERIEFESFKLNREKVVEPGQTILMKVPALRPGSYDFFDDFHDKVPEGEIVAR